MRRKNFILHFYNVPRLPYKNSFFFVWLILFTMLSTFFNVLCCDPINKNCIDSWNESWLKKIIRLREFFGERCVSEQTFFFGTFQCQWLLEASKKGEKFKMGQRKLFCSECGNNQGKNMQQQRHTKKERSWAKEGMAVTLHPT